VIWWQLGDYLELPTTSLEAPESASNKPCSTSNYCGAGWEKWRVLWEDCLCAWNSKPLPYCWTTFKSHIVDLHSGLCIYIATNLPTLYLDSSAKWKVVWKSYLIISPTLNSHTDPSRCVQMLPDRLNAMRCALSCLKTTSPVFLNAPEVVDHNTWISWAVYSGFQNAFKSNYYVVKSLKLLGVIAVSPIACQWTSNLEPSPPEVIMIMFISNSTIQLTIFLLHTLIQTL